jgi:high affinity sulfate transporter 1
MALPPVPEPATRLDRIAPGLGVLRRYQLPWLRGDLVAGLTVGALLITQCMAYAPLADLPPNAAFHAAIIGIPLYALFGTSRHLAIGPDPGTAILAATGLTGVAAVGTESYLAAAAALAVLVGIVLLIGGLVRLGFLADLLSRPALAGYLTGLGVTLFVGQISKAAGIPVTADSFLGKVGDIVSGLGDLQWGTFAMSASVLGLILVMKRVMPGLPAALIGVVLALVATAVFNLDAHGIKVVGDIDADLPWFAWPGIPASDWVALIPTALGVALVGYADSILTARGVAAKKGYDLDANNELSGLGVANTAAGLFQGMPVASTGSGTAAMSSAGGVTTAAGIIAAAFVALGISLFPGVLEQIPQPALAAVVMAAAIGLLEVADLRAILKVSKAEFALGVATFLAVVLTDVLIGVLVSVALGVIIALYRIARPHDAILGSAVHLDGWVDVDAHEGASTLPGLLVYRFDAPLFFANATRYLERVEKALELNPGEERWVVLDFEGVGYVDSTALLSLADLVSDLATAHDISVVGLARANDVVVGKLTTVGLMAPDGPLREFPTINAAVAAFQLEGGAAS